MIEEREELQGQLISSGQVVASMIAVKGDKGDTGSQGIPGQDGISPVASVSKVDDTATITITDANGTTTASISDGTDGQDGFSPIANVSKSGKIATITITDSLGTTTAEIRDGEDGQGSGDMLKATYDTDNNGIVDNAEKVNNHTVQSDVPADAVFTDTTYTAGTGIEITAGNVINNTQTSAEWGNITGTISDQADLKSALDTKGTYSKPSSGIPKTDLANAVQTSLGKADTAIQSSDLSTVATSGSYNDLSNKPTIPTKVSDLTNDSGFINKNVNDLTNYTTTSVINTLLAGKENNIPIQDTTPQNPEENDLWIDTNDDNRLKYYNGTSWNGVSDNITGDTLPIGSIIPYGGITPPTGWLLCWGQTVNKSSFPELFDAIGYAFGGEEGEPTFGIPNLKGKVVVGQDTSQTEFNEMGKTGGSKYLQKHKHTEIDWLADTSYPLSLNTGDTQGYAITNWSSGVGSGRIGTNEAGTGESGNLQPYTVTNYIIKAKQVAGLVGAVSDSSSNSHTDSYSCDYINNAVLDKYSTTEQIIGTWIDGSTIYRKVVPFTTTWSSNEQTVALVSGYSTIIKVDVFSEDGRNLAWYDKSQIDCYMSNGSLKFKPNNADFNNKSWNATVEYTKDE